MPGWELERNTIDPMHGLNLGVTQHLLANCIWDWAVESAELKKDIPTYLERLWEDTRDA
jgi:hypothetical protein